MGLRSFLGFGSSSSSSSSPGTATRTSGTSTGGWYSYDPAEALRHHREAQVSLPVAERDSRGRRKYSPKPDPQHVNETFWRS